MCRGFKRALMIMGVLSLCISASSQNFSYDATEKQGSNAPLRGKPAVDVIYGNRSGLGFPLRYGGVVPGSVRVESGGSSFKEGKDYSIDYLSGVVYLSVPLKSNEIVRVTYRHDPEIANQKDSNTLPTLSLNIRQDGSLKMYLGMNSAQRFADGSIMETQGVGLQNQFSMGKTNISGLYFVSSQKRANVVADFSSPDQSAPKAGIEGTDSFIQQNVRTDIGSGMEITADYRQVGEKFTGFGMLESAGIESNQVKQLEKEKGLSRYSFGFNGGNEKHLQFKNSFQVIEDGDSKITWQDYNVKTGGLEFYFNSRDIDRNFSRFKDIAEKEREQLQKEKGIYRQNFGAKMNFGVGALSFSDSLIEDALGGINRRSFNLQSKYLNASFNSQKVDYEFARANDLVDAEKTQWAKERGLQRNEINIGIPNGDKASYFAFNQKTVEFQGNKFKSENYGFNFGKFGFEYWTRETSDGFYRLADLSQAELDGMIEKTLQMYDPNAKVNQKDRNFITKETGLERTFWRFTASPLPDTLFRLDNININSNEGAIKGYNLLLNSKNINLSFRKASIDKNFNRIGDLLEYERNLFGTQTGFDRSDMSLNWKINDKTILDLTGLNVQSEQGGAHRWSGSLKAPNFEFKGSMRKVDETFSRANEINDSEKALFYQLIGFNQWDVMLKWSPIKQISFEGSLYDAINGEEDLRRYHRDLKLAYSPDKLTSFSVRMYGHKFGGEVGTLFENNLALIEGQRDFGKFGKLTLRRENEYLGGSNAKTPSRQTEYAKYETKLFRNADFAVENMRTNFQDGGFETVQAYRLNYQLSKKFGFNYSELFVNRNDDKPDQRIRAFGFSYDIGNGFKVGLNWFRELNSNADGKQNYKWDMSGGSYGGFEFGGYYDEKRIDNKKTLSLGNFSLSNKNPINFLFMKNIMIKFGYDSEKDSSLWKKENKIAGITTNMFGSEFGASYAQVMVQSGQRAADRGFSFKLDPSGKKDIQANLMYKVRTVPGGDSFIIRDYNISYKAGEDVKLVHKVNNLQEQAKNDVFLGSTLLPVESRSWAIEYNYSKSITSSFQFDELARLDQKTLARRLTANVSLFNHTGSPLKLMYGVEQNDNKGNRKTRHIWEIGFDQKPGPNQMLNLLVGTVRWEHGIPSGAFWNNWILRVDYQVRF